jgi:predicted hydrolase (HD superfamily)
LKLIERERARERLLVEKLRMQRTKHTVLNQQMLHPATRQTRNTCIAIATYGMDQFIDFIVACMLWHVFTIEPLLSLHL